MSELPLNRKLSFRPFVLAFWALEVAIATIYSLLPAKTLGNVPGSDKLWHSGGYALLALPLCFLFRERRWVWLAVIGLVAYGVALEFGQEFVPGRNFEAADMVANSIGVLVGVLFSHKLASLSYWQKATLAKSGD